MRTISRKEKTIITLFSAAIIFVCLLSFALSIPEQKLISASAEPAQTYNIRSADDFIDYSLSYAAGEKNPEDVLNISITSGSSICGDGFISLGTSERPFAGTLIIPAAGIDTFILANCPLFNYVTTDMTIGGSGIVKIMREQANETPDVGVLTEGALFANHVVAGSNAANWRISLSPYSGDGTAATSYPGVIGDIASGCSVQIAFTDTTSLSVSGSSNLGLICGTLKSNASLSVSTAGSGSPRALSSSSGHCGGLVGKMESGATLQFKSNNLTRINSVSTDSGYAGGIVGYADVATIQFGAGVTTYDVQGSVTGTTGAGGLFGYFKNNTASFGLDKYGIESGMTISGSGNVGGVFGHLDNTATSFSFDGNADGSEVFSVNLSSGAARGGVCGKFSTALLTDTIIFTNVGVTVTSPSGSGYSGGIIGTVSDSPAYISLYGIYVTSSSLSANALSGGLIGNTGNGGSFIDVSGAITIDKCCDAGLIGNMPKGVLRIQGTTNLGTFTQKDWSSGTIVKDRDRALIYALGDGKGTNGNWTLKRNLSNSLDDVHSWGQVLRVDGTILAENDLFTIDMTAHNVTVKGAATTIGTVTQFALTALNIKLNTGAGVGALLFTSGSSNLSSTLLSGTLALGADISLDGTGLLGFTRDDGKNNSFSGTFNGNDHSITFASGKPYGLNASGSALEANSKQGNIYRHGYNGLFAQTNGATVSDLTLSGQFIIYQSADIDLGGVTARATGSLLLDNVAVDYTLNYKTTSDYTFRFGGAVGFATNNGLAITLSDCDIQPTVNETSADGLENEKYSYFGAAIGTISSGDNLSPSQSVTFDGTTLALTYAKTTNTSRSSVFGGAIATIFNASYVKNRRTVSFINGSSIDLTVTGATCGGKFGGILGTEWLAVDVTIGGLTIDSSIAATGSTTNFGGLVQTATGGWIISALTVSTASYTLPNNSSTFGFVANKTSTNASFSVNSSNHTGESALYLSIVYSTYDIENLTFTGGIAFSSFDELVCDSRYKSNSLRNNGNSVISVTTSGNAIATAGDPNTYLNKTAYGRTSSGRINSGARYYYNIEYARANTATAKYNFLLWSVKQYAHESLSAWFVASSTFTGSLDMTGLSYYPVDLPSSTVTFRGAVLKLDSALTESRVKYAYYYDDDGVQSSDARSTTASGNQHYLMHTSVFRNVTGTVDIEQSAGVGLTMQGNVPKLSDTSCGFFISGMLGNSDTINAKVTAEKLLFDGVHITLSGNMMTSDAYVPLFINNVGKSSSLTIAGATQSTTAYSSYAASGYYAASSLIGDVGSETARAIYLTFSGLVFDSRSTASSIGNMSTAYGTTTSVFKRATVLNSFLYFGESSGSYDFELDEDWSDSTTAIHNVTYGKEIKSSAEYIELEQKYSGSEFYVHPTAYQSGSEYDFSSGFLPYVYTAHNAGQHKHELRVNITISTTIEGCGKYGDPFIIDDDNKLYTIANIIATNSGSASVKIYLPHDIATVFDWTSTSYTKKLYTFGSPYASSDDTIAADTVRRYLTGAYYVVTRDITLPSDYVGLGASNEDSASYAFRGIIIGRGNPTITNNSQAPLIHTALGCVVQNLTVDVAVDKDSSNQINLAAPTGSSEYKYRGGNQFYGAVIGQILGGDNFIDSVQVDFSDVTFNLTASDSSHYVRLIPVGGYVGVLVNGGLIFRNMTSSNVGLTSSTFDKISDTGYLYVNPIIGRVIAGYAFHETDAYRATESATTLKNRQKNYTICDLSLSAGKLSVARSSSTFTVTVPDGQALFVLGAIVNSGASSASYNASTEQAYDSLTDFWSAYRAYTTTRAGATYENVGTSGFDSSSDYTDYAVYDSYTTTAVKIPYIIRAYTNKTGSVYLARCVSTTTGVTVLFTGNCVVSEGFRGIGSIYVNSNLTHLDVAKCSGQIGSSTSSYQLTFNMRYLEYNHKSISKYIGYAASGSSDSSAGFGLFTRLTMTSPSASNSIQYLTLSGNIFYDVYRLDTGVPAAYNFAMYKNSSGYDRTEANSITSGDTEDATLRRTLLSVGGIAGFAKTKFYIKNVTFNDLYVEGAKTAGGLIGFVFQGTNDRSYVTYTTGVANAGFVNVVGGLQAGGLIGRIFRAPIEITGADGGTDIIIRNVESKNSDPDETGMYYFANINTGVGGLVGTCWAIDKDTGESAFGTTTRRLFITDINVVKGSQSANVRVLNDSGTKMNYAGGFVGSAHNVWLKIENCNLQNVNVTANVAGGFVGKMTQKYFLYIKGCATEGSLENDTKLYAITGTRYAGGAVGWTLGRDTLYFQLLNFMTKDYTVRSTITTQNPAGAGGVLGYAQGNNKPTNNADNYICEFNNLTVLNCDIETNYTNKTDNYLKYKCGTGGLIGVIDTINVDNGNLPNENNRNETFKYKFSGYNILIKDTTLTHLNGGSTPDNSAFTNLGASANRRIGDLVGNNAVQSPLWFVGVAVQNATYCGKHVGYWDSDLNNYGNGYYAANSATTTNGYVVFANYQESASNSAFTTSVNDTTSASAATDNFDYVDEATASYPYVTVNPSFTFGGHTLTGDGVASSVANLAIQSIIADGSTATAKYSYGAAAYYSGSSGENNLTTFNSHYLSKLVMFTSEVSGYIGTDFPVLILDTTDRNEATKMINSYLRLLTNTTYDFGEDLTNIFEIFIYKMDYDNGSFTPTVLGASLKRSDGDFYMTNNSFDSGKLQFSLIDLRFFNPADTSKVAYRLFVPVFVKKVLSYQFDIAVDSGTTYLQSKYTSSYGQALIENIGSPVTFYFSYTYQRTAAEWTSAINAGENVNRSYAKNLMFYKANTNDILNAFPSDAVLVLVDPNKNGSPYYSTIGDALTGNVLALSSFYTLFSKSDGVITLSGSAFSPILLSDLLGLTVTTVGEGDRMVACAIGSATVVVSGQGYRLATDEELADGSITKYTVTASVSNPVERYYLSLYTESNVVNDALFHYYLVTSPSAFAETEYPSRISDTNAHTMVHLVMGKIFYHSGFSVSSSSLDDFIMTADNNVLNIDLRAVIGFSDDLDEEIKSNLEDIIDDTEVYQSFLVYLNRKDSSGVSKAILGSPTGAGTYNIDYVLNGVKDTSGTMNVDYIPGIYSVGNINLTQNYAEFVTSDLSSVLSEGNKFEITASVSLTYSGRAITTQFPGRGTTTPDNGVTISGSSNLAFSVSNTAYSKNSLSADETPPRSYYSEAEPEVAILDLNPIGDKVGDFTLLGINALNNNSSNDPTIATFELLAVMDVAAIADQISGYEDLVMTITLEQKQNNGSYGSSLNISDYLTLQLAGLSDPATITDNGTSFSTIIAKDDLNDSGDNVLTDNGAHITLPTLQFTVKTGTALETAGLTYGNYRVTVNMVLRDDEENEYTLTRVSNYVIYTNAKIIPDYIVQE